MTKHRKAQAALEFLTTYGWAILVVLVMIGALAYFGVLNPSKFAQERCVFSGAEMTCTEATLINGATKDSIKFTLRNNMPDDYILLGTSKNITYTISGGDSGVCTPEDTTIRKDGGTATITCDLESGDSIGSSGDKKKVTLDFMVRKSGGTLNISKSMDIVSTVQ